MSKEGRLDIAYDLSDDEDLAILSVFVNDGNKIKMIRSFIGAEATELYNKLTTRVVSTCIKCGTTSTFDGRVCPICREKESKT